eukprot:TRINITY_DN454_c0_g1_i2.p1 TRINITY_DN454_c0_g1~~TRINITY_DN454_c0_g1_i2.p1  ORF type:complete len:339 (+),score=62.78 TRINITY_DN454_c0_g1_i2:292-1308(+)
MSKFNQFGDPKYKSTKHCSVHIKNCAQARELTIDPIALTQEFYFFAWGDKAKSKHFPSFEDYLSRISSNEARYCKSMYNKVKLYKKAQDNLNRDFQDFIRENPIDEPNLDDKMDKSDTSTDESNDELIDSTDDDKSETFNDNNVIDTDSDIVFICASLDEKEERITTFFCLIQLKEQDFEFLREIEEKQLQQYCNQNFDCVTSTSKRQLFSGTLLERTAYFINVRKFLYLKILQRCVLKLMEKNHMKVCIGITKLQEIAVKKKIDCKKVNIRGEEEFHHPDCNLLVDLSGTSYSNKYINFRKKLKHGKEYEIRIKDPTPPTPSTLEDFYKECLSTLSD